MPALSSSRLASKLLGSLEGAAIIGSDEAKPIILDVPDVGRIRVYIWTVTQDHSSSGRPPDEHKIQLIIPGTERRSRQVLELDQMPTFLLGFSPVFGVFASWEAAMHRDHGYSANLQVSEELLSAATEHGWAIDKPRRVRAGFEVRAAVHPIHLKEFLLRSIEADRQGVSAEERQKGLETKAPWIAPISNHPGFEWPGSLEDVAMLRDIELSRRMKRARSFSPKVLAAFSWSCAVCGVQLGTVEAAHIIPAHHSKGVDEMWNGIALCANHHRLFDSGVFSIDRGGVLRVDQESIEVLRGMQRAVGFGPLLEAFEDRRIQGLRERFPENSSVEELMSQAFALMRKFSVGLE